VEHALAASPNPLTLRRACRMRMEQPLRCARRAPRRAPRAPVRRGLPARRL